MANEWRFLKEWDAMEGDRVPKVMKKNLDGT